MPSALETSIYRTLAYFEYFKYPLTSFEIWKWLLAPGQTVALGEVVACLDKSDWLKSKVSEYQGFYALGQVAAWRQDRHLRFLDAMRKFHKVSRLLHLFGRLPWVDGIAVCNSLSWHHTKSDSDIDLFFIVKPGRIWSVRLLATIPVMLLRQRPGEATSDPICLSFFCTSDALAFETLKIGDQDPYLAYWCRSLVPLVDHGGWMDKFEMYNPWLREVLPQAQYVRRASRFRSDMRIRWPWLPLRESLAKQIQMEHFPAAIRELMNRDSRVVITDQMLKFHDRDARAQILKALDDKLAAL